MGMRRGNNSIFVVNVDRTLAGLQLGSDFTSEHEWGIKGIQQAFGMDLKANGIARRTITRHPVRWFAKVYKGYTLAGFSSWYKEWDGKPVTAEDVFRTGEIREKSTFGKNTYHDKLQTAWDSDHFCAFSADPDDQANLHTIFEALEADDAIIMLSGGHRWLGGGGLAIGILSLIPDTVKKTLLDADLTAIRLKKEFADTGIEKRLTAASKQWFALRPDYREDGTIRVFLNPMEQKQNNCGWFSVADLDAWITNEGPIPMKGANAKVLSR